MYRARVMMSPNTPAAVMAGPAPGPLTMSDGLQYREVVKDTMFSVLVRPAKGWLLENRRGPTCRQGAQGLGVG